MLSVLLAVIAIDVIPDHGPDQFTISPRAALVEFYDETTGPTKQLGKLKDLGHTVERVRIVDNKSRLAAHYEIEKLPTFMAIFARKEVARAEGAPTTDRLTEMYNLARKRETYQDAVLEGQMIYFGESSFYPCKEAKELLEWLEEAGCDIRRANFDDPTHAAWFERYKVEEYPLFMQLGKEGAEIIRCQGMTGLPLLRRMKDIITQKPVPQTGPRLLDFWAPWCTECLRMDPVLAGLKEAGHDVRKINVDEDTFTADKYRIDELPAFVVLDGSGAESGRITGKTTGDALLLLLKSTK